jgi:uncharacterized protein (TIGR03437 family)
MKVLAILVDTVQPVRPLPNTIAPFLLLALAPAAWAQFAPVMITTSALPGGTKQVNYVAQVNSTTSSSSASWSVSGSLPPGVSLTGATGPNAVISGVPTSGGLYSFAIQVSDPQTDSMAAKNLSISVATPLQFTTTSPLPTGIVGTNYSQNMIVSGGTPGYSFKGVGVPPGLQLTASGTLFGTPSAYGSYNVSITVTDQAQNSLTNNFTLNIAPPLQFTTTSPLPTAVATAVYTQTISVTGGTVPYSFVITDTPPPGLTLSLSGVLNGVPSSIGTFTFTVQVTDELNFTTSMQYKVTFTGAPPLLQVSPSTLSFASSIGGNAPPSQSLSIVSTNGSAAPYAITVDSGAPGTPAPAWLTVSPLSGTSPASIIVAAAPGQLTAQTYKATIHVTVPKSTSQASVDISVSYAIGSGSPSLQPLPASLAFGANAATPGIQQQTIVLNNGGGGGQLGFSAAVVNQSPWITSVSPATGSTAPNSPVFVQIQVNTQGLNVGAYHDIIRIIASSSSVDVPVSLFVASQGPILALNVTGLRFQARQGAGASRPQNVPVLNIGSASSIVNWTADLVSGSNWLNITTPNGMATPGQPGTLMLTPNSAAANLPAGPQYALVRVSDSNSQNSPQYLTAVFDDEPAASPSLPDPSPAGLFFTSASASQPVSVYTSSVTPIGFQVSATTTDGANWLTVTPASGIASTAIPGQLTVSVIAGNLGFGIYTGSINIGMSGALRVVNVTLVVIPSGFTPSLVSNVQSHATASCNASALALTETGLVNNFAVPAGWPATLVVQLNDNCGNSIPNGAVVASFSNGDPPLSLRGDQATNVYSATWQPGTAQPQMTVALQGTAGTLRPATAQLTGAINANSSSPPTLLPNGTLHIFFNVSTAEALGAGLAPGNVAQVYGTGLAPSLIGSSTVPLQTQIDGTFMLIGGIQAPMFFVSQSPIAVQVPYELNANQQYSAVVSANGALSLPITISVVPLQPGMDANPDGSVIAQHSADYSPVSAASPAHPGDTITIYLAGMGATATSVPSGAPSPGAYQTTVQPLVYLDGQNCFVAYAGLTPSGIGLYQINFTVPANARSGNLNLLVTQGGVNSNTTALPVSN